MERSKSGIPGRELSENLLVGIYSRQLSDPFRRPVALLEEVEEEVKKHHGIFNRENCNSILLKAFRCLQILCAAKGRIFLLVSLPSS